MDQNFDFSVFPKFEAPSEGGLPYMLDTCREGPSPIDLGVEKTQNFDKVSHRGPGGQNGPNFSLAIFHQI